jgi:hypothetical protein
MGDGWSTPGPVTLPTGKSFGIIVKQAGWNTGSVYMVVRKRKSTGVRMPNRTACKRVAILTTLARPAQIIYNWHIQCYSGSGRFSFVHKHISKPNDSNVVLVSVTETWKHLHVIWLVTLLGVSHTHTHTHTHTQHLEQPMKVSTIPYFSVRLFATSCSSFRRIESVCIWGSLRNPYFLLPCMKFKLIGSRDSAVFMQNKLTGLTSREWCFDCRPGRDVTYIASSVHPDCPPLQLIRGIF